MSSRFALHCGVEPISVQFRTVWQKTVNWQQCMDIRIHVVIHRRFWTGRMRGKFEKRLYRHDVFRGTPQLRTYYLHPASLYQMTYSRFKPLNGLLRSVIEAMYVSGGEEDASSLYDRAGPHLYAQRALKTGLHHTTKCSVRHSGSVLL